jgi:glyoxylase-like metal-dependent hydrolase (beta-lactamase superfamily II)
MEHTESLVKVAEGIYQAQLPLPFALKIVNCYLLDDGDGGWTILDSGLNYYADQDVWQAAFDALGITPSHVRRIVLTHNHPDHYGLAGWLQAQSGAPVQMSKIEADGARVFWIDAETHYDAIREQQHHAGAPADVVDEIIEGVAFTIAMTAPHPTHVEHITPGETVRFGGRNFTPILAPGHSDGQLIFYDAADNLLLSGDHVLMKITPVVGLWPETEPHPLGRFMASLWELRGLDVRVALPGHRALITDWQGRIDELLAHHDQRLSRTLDVVSGGATAYEVAGALFNLQKLSVHDMRFALVEALAHLDYLVEHGAIRQTLTADEVWRFEK